MEDREKLKHLMEHWIEHNREHADEFRQWADKANGFGESAVHDDIMEAVEHLNKANESLNKASKRWV
ncbi:MAG: hypothetical protein HOC20_08800 [Chloroflexi bacterium]|mgnify:FL=1|jgi:hypothetical protein|nr:hypothetical protein [Chloroflexota bacterium]